MPSPLPALRLRGGRQPRLVAGHVATQPPEVCFPLLLPEALERGLSKLRPEQKLAGGRGREVLSLEIKATCHEGICDLGSF